MRLFQAAILAGGLLFGSSAVEAQTATVDIPLVGVPVLDRAIAKGDQFAAGDFVTQDMPAAQGRGGLRIKDVAGMEAVHALPAGAIVRASDVIRPQLVRRGEPVTIVLRDGALSITAEGRALASGAAGDFVRIVSVSTNRTLDGVVEGAGAVRISAR